MTTIRAALVVALLGGYRVGRACTVAILMVGACMAWWVSPGILATVVTGGAVLMVTLMARAGRALRGCVHRTLDGTVVDPAADSVLWREVRVLCGRLDVPVPEEIRLGVDPRVEVWEQGRRWGLRAGPSQLYLGLPLLAGLPPRQLRALLAHELAHDYRGEGQLPAVCRRIRSTLGSLLERRPRAAGVLFMAWARLILGIEAPVSREQEFRADRAAVLVSGKADLVAALRELPALTRAWDRYLTEVIRPAAKDGYAPLSLSHGFNQARERWREDLEPLRVAAPDCPRPPWDAHPSWPERMLHIDMLIEPRSIDEAAELPLKLVSAARQVETELLGAQVRRVPWEEFLAITASQPLRDEVAQLYQAAAAVAHPGVPADIDTVLALLEAGRRDDLVSWLEPPEPTTARRLLAVAFAQAAVDGGVARWRRGWSGELQVVRADGGAVPVEELATRVMVDPATVPMVREVVRSVQERPSSSAMIRQTAPSFYP
ncbi:MAG: M48 family metalloprotease [Micromonosporaceae bacterium]